MCMYENVITKSIIMYRYSMLMKNNKNPDVNILMFHRVGNSATWDLGGKYHLLFKAPNLTAYTTKVKAKQKHRTLHNTETPSLS